MGIVIIKLLLMYVLQLVLQHAQVLVFAPVLQDTLKFNLTVMLEVIGMIAFTVA